MTRNLAIHTGPKSTKHFCLLVQQAFKRLCNEITNTIITNMKRFVPLSLIALGTLVILGVLVLFYRSDNANASLTAHVPPQIAGVRMSNSKTGDDAIEDVARMHSKEFPVTYGVIAVYGDREITLWVSGAPSADIAQQMTHAMRDKIAQRNSPFTPTEEIQENNRTVYVLEGMGQIQYYFQSQDRVIWLAVNPAFADKALQQILEVYS